MPITAVLISILGAGILNMISSAVANYFEGEDVGVCAKSGLAGGLAAGVFAYIAFVVGINFSQ